MWPGLSVFTLMPLGPSSQAMLRPIWMTADLDVLYDTHAWSCTTSRVNMRTENARVRSLRRSALPDLG